MRNWLTGYCVLVAWGLAILSKHTHTRTHSHLTQLDTLILSVCTPLSIPHACRKQRDRNVWTAHVVNQWIYYNKSWWYSWRRTAYSSCDLLWMALYELFCIISYEAGQRLLHTSCQNWCFQMFLLLTSGTLTRDRQILRILWKII